MNGFLTATVTVLTAIIGLGILSIVLSPKATTQGLVSTFFSGFNQSLSTAESPVSGQASSTGAGVGNLASYLLPAYGNTANMI